MKRAGLIFMAVMLVASSALATDAVSPIHLARRFNSTTPDTVGEGRSQTLVIPADTEFRVRFLSGVQTQVNHVDDPVLVQLTAPVFINGQMALPTGTYVGGRITVIHAARRLHRPGKLAFRFDQIMLPDGEQGPVSAVLSHFDNPKKLRIHLDSEGYMEGQKRLSWRNFLLGAVSAGGLATAKVIGLSTTAMAGLIPATGAAVISYELFWGRGSEINLPPETPCRLRLQTSLVVRTAT